ncbi:chaperone protein DnaJ, partial [Tanacetum coccineum]
EEGHANDKEIKMAYGRLAKYYHPDGEALSGCLLLGKSSTAAIFTGGFLQSRELFAIGYGF